MEAGMCFEFYHGLADKIYDMSKSTNTVVYFDWKMSHTIYAANGKISHIHRRMCE